MTDRERDLGQAPEVEAAQWGGVWEVERYELWEAAGDAVFSGWSRREFLQAAGGVVVCLLVRPAVAQPPPRGRFFSGSAPRQIGAWLHLDEKGNVTAYSGKVEVGQNVRTMLVQAVAEELRVPVERITMVLGDTQQCPFDAGTFGSRSAPSMVPQMRRAAAALREVLLDLAAERWQVSRDALAAEQGEILHKGDGRRIPYQELAGGQRIMRIIPDDVPLQPPDRWQVQGTAVKKVNALQIVTGKHRYTSDVQLPGMLYGKVLRPPALRARLRSVEIRHAESREGVVVVRDGDFVGVAAPTAWDAEQALAAIEADWEVAPEPDDHNLYEDLKRSAVSGDARFSGRAGFGRSGAAGDVERSLREADIVLEQAYRVAYIAHAPLEPRAAVAQWEDGRLTVWTGTQRPFGVRDELARQFGLSPDQVRVIVPDTGSGYGGKHTGEAAIEAARLARAAGRPVKLVWTREEEFQWAYFRPAGLIEIRSGVRRDGRLIAWECHNYNSGQSALATPYDVPNRRVEFHRSDAPLRQGSYRALAATANTFARETHMDELAVKLQLDPVEFRLKNLTDPRLTAVLKAAVEAFGWGKPAQNGRGFGVACGTEKGSYVATCAEVEVDPEEKRVRVVRAVTAFECGAILNPDQLRNQVEGALVMGLGGALWEEIRFQQGKITNARFSAYRVPRFRDIPSIEVVLLDRKDLPSAGAGETPIIAIAPAVGNAIYAACGIRLRSMPLLGDEWKAATSG
ncbi:MAG: aldehyde dehydrogenase [Pirellulaceae bacterium]|nr:MAG: aldehyde dehydrogenase [Pirellulaceae bacterium]